MFNFLEKVKMKGKKWIEERKSVLLKELIHQMLWAKLFFDGLYICYKKSGKISFQKLAHWIGTEENKGVLWKLKDSSHLLFRNNISRHRFYENVFDWTLGSIFHEGMKLKEDVYIREVYQKWGAIFTKKGKLPPDVNIKELTEEYETIIKRAKESNKQEMENLHYLFTKAMEQLKKVIIQNKNDPLLNRFLLENKDLVERVYGKGALTQLFASMYKNGLIDAYIKAGKAYREGGWYIEALKTLEQALKEDPQHKEAKKEYETTKKMIETTGG